MEFVLIFILLISIVSFIFQFKGFIKALNNHYPDYPGFLQAVNLKSVALKQYNNLNDIQKKSIVHPRIAWLKNKEHMKVLIIVLLPPTIIGCYITFILLKRWYPQFHKILRKYLFIGLIPATILILAIPKEVPFGGIILFYSFFCFGLPSLSLSIAGISWMQRILHKSTCEMIDKMSKLNASN